MLAVRISFPYNNIIDIQVDKSVITSKLSLMIWPRQAWLIDVEVVFCFILP